LRWPVWPIPVLLHLTQKEKKEVVFFPSLMFVRKIPYQASRRRRIQHWFLLLLRLAALALIILAFARPLLDRADAPAGARAGRARSRRAARHELQHGVRPALGGRGRCARNAVSGLGPSDRASIVAFGSGTEILLRSTAEHSALTAPLPRPSLAPRPPVTRRR
jgi:hypothetical protein